MRDTTTRGDESTGEVLLVQRRVALFGFVGVCLTIVSVVISTVQFHVEKVDFPLFARGLLILGGVVMAVAWLSCRKEQRSLAFVRAIEIAATLACTVTFSVMCTQFPAVVRPDLVATLIIAQVVTARAILVPSSGRRTAVISVIASIPLFGVALVVGERLEAITPGGVTITARQLLGSAFAWTVLTTSLATVAASVIYGLRRQVRKAMELGQYTLLEKLGEGGMGQVFRARHAMLRRPTAVKLLHSESAEDLARFEREVQLTAQLTHP